MISWMQQGAVVIFHHVSTDINNLGQLCLNVQVFMILSIIPVAIGSSSLPFLSRTSRVQMNNDRIFVDTMLRGSLIFGGAVILAAMDLGPWIFKIFLGSQYAAAGALLKYTMWLLILWAWGQFISQVLIARGHFIIFTLCGLTGALILTLTLPLCVSNIDTIGAVISTGLGMAFWALSMLAVLVRLNIAALNVSIFRIVVAVFISLVIYFLFRPISFWLALPISWFALFYGSLWLRGISKEEKSAIVYFWKKFYKIPHSSL